MSNAAITHAFSTPIDRSSDKFIFVALANYADDSGICYPSQTKLIGDTSLDRKTVISGIQRLCDRGLIVDTGHRKGATGQIIVYRILGVSGTPPVHYTYRVTCPKLGQFYLGKRSCDGDPQADPYRGSGRWVAQVRAEGRVLIKEVLQTFETTKEALAHEQMLFRQFENDPLCMNEGTPLRHRMASMAGLASSVASANIPKTELLTEQQTVPFFPSNDPVFGTVRDGANSPVFPVEQSRFSHQAVPNFPPNSPENGTRNPQGTIREPSRTPIPQVRAARSDDAKAIADAVEIWNSVCGPKLPAVQKLTDQRKKAIAARIREDFAGDVENWRACCEIIVASTFLTTGNGTWPGATFDWVMKPSNMTKILEGNFTDRPAAKAPAKPADKFAWLDEPTHQPKFDLEATADVHGTFRPH